MSKLNSDRFGGKILLVVDQHSIGRRQWQPTAVLLPEKSQGQKGLVGCRLRGHQESDMTERLHFHFSLSCTGEGNGNPLQGSCLQNPRDGGAWWAAVDGVVESDKTKATQQQQQHSILIKEYGKYIFSFFWQICLKCQK